MHCLWAMTYALFIYVLLLLQTELLVILHIYNHTKFLNVIHATY